MTSKGTNYYGGIAIVLGIVAIAVILIGPSKIKEKMTPECDNNSGERDLPQSAREACGKISTEAENIKAAMSGTAEILRNVFLPFINPNNFRSGDNNTNNIVQNIVNTNLSHCEVMDIHNMCSNSASVAQTNTIDTRHCNCDKPGSCNFSGIVQTNESTINQTCMLNMAIKKLMEKTESTRAQALAKVMQEAEGLLSGNNTSSTEVCNIINKDLSTSEWLRAKNECMNDISAIQENLIAGCGKFTDITQKNISNKLQECVQGIITETETSIDSKTDIKTETTIDQLTKGIDTNSSISSSISSFILLLMCSIMVMYMFSESTPEQRTAIIQAAARKK
jgi:hypothetical protein